MIANRRAFSRSPTRSSVAKYSPVLFGGAKNPLLRDLAVYWKLDEASGTRFDSVGSQDLTEHGIVTQETGLISSAAGFDGDTDNYLSAANNAAINLGMFDWAYVLWIYFLDHSVNYYPLCKGGASGAGNMNAQLKSAATTGVMTLKFGFPTGTLDLVGDAIPALQWSMIYAAYDSVNDLMLLKIDDNATDSRVFGQTFNTDIWDLYLGIHPNPLPFNGYIDEVGFWKRLLSPAELAILFNAGAGKSYPFR